MKPIHRLALNYTRLCGGVLTSENFTIYDSKVTCKKCLKILNKKVSLCEKCGKNPASPPHSCPFAEEIWDDTEEECTCCDDCTQDCANDI